jgi:hypothetical protein
MMSMEDDKSRVNTNDYAWLAYKDTFLEQIFECALRGRRPLRWVYTGFALGLPMVGSKMAAPVRNSLVGVLSD